MTSFSGHQFLASNLIYENLHQADSAQRLRSMQRFFGSAEWTPWHTRFVERFGVTHVLINDRCPPNWDEWPTQLDVVSKTGDWTLAKVRAVHGALADASDVPADDTWRPVSRAVRSRALPRGVKGARRAGAGATVPVVPRVKSLSVVIPVFNSALALPELVERLAHVMPTCASELEIVLVDDGSSDGSWSTIERLSEVEPTVRGIALGRNYGQHNALLAGVRAATGEVIVTMDDDLQHRPEEIPKLLQALTPEVDLVYGLAREREHGMWRHAASQVSKIAMGLTLGWETASKVSAFRAFRHWLVGAFADVRDPYVNLDVLVSWTTGRIAATTVEMDARRYGRSNYTLRALVRHATNMVTGFSAVPLRLVAWVGFSMATCGLLVILWVIGRLLVTGASVPGFPFLASTIAMFSGAILVSLGIIGEYLGRLHFRSMGKPPYWVRETRSGRKDAEIPTSPGSRASRLERSFDGSSVREQIGLRHVDSVQHELQPETQTDPGALGT